MVKVVTFFLIGMAILAIFGRLRFPRIGTGRGAARCPSCGRPLIGRGPCDCGGKA
ncbi:hypothetical protein OEZ60_11065 [Defluviimonas sp. WL0024]|uniref:Short-chain dehydrogenase n=2 Tax=Albidovulum TaxID=205889 RepID=A0ABT3IYH7_9RHOB|nr:MULTISPECIES: hypothetical protein [Defluviimonas]MCU9848551.1 hypothetical protein [Defluviimonas sp. WL0024]MCW3780465.1 hypothetical protein [Defluviimonas salinarum]